MAGISTPLKAESRELLHVSYDPTGELFKDINAVFIGQWQTSRGEQVKIYQSHGGSGKQARSVIDGLEADVVSLALSYDIDKISSETKLLPPDWQARLPNHSCPYTSTIVFLVRTGNPKAIRDWSDLVRPSISVVTPNPKTSGGARWNYLAAWGYALRTFAGDESKSMDFMRRLYANVSVLDAGARGATTTFVQRGIGDVLITWENEALSAVEKFAAGSVEVIIPSLSVLAEPPVALIDKVVDAKGTREVAEAYLKFLYTRQAQDIIARHFFRPQEPEVLEMYRSRFAALHLLSIDRDFGGWNAVQSKHFRDGGIFDQIFLVNR